MWNHLVNGRLIWGRAMRPEAHPDRQHIAHFSMGRLCDAESRAIEAHLDHCEICREYIVETAASDVFIDWLRKTHEEKDRQSAE